MFSALVIASASVSWAEEAPVAPGPVKNAMDILRGFGEAVRTQGLTESDLSKIKESSPNKFLVPQALRAKALYSLPTLLRQARVTQIPATSTAWGFSVQRLQTPSIYSRLGLKQGDTIRSVNGQALKSKEDAVVAFRDNRFAETVKVEIVRNGRPIVMSYQFV